MEAQKAESFIRLEEKYLLPKELLQEFHSLLVKHSAPSYPNPATTFNIIESVYFDSFQLNFYQDHFQSAARRCKLRVRRYAPNGIWDDNGIHLELKVKDKDLTLKERIRITKGDLADLQFGRPIQISFELERINRSFSKQELLERVERINGQIIKYHVRPCCRLTYERRAFEKDKFRVTYDTDLKFAILNPIDLPIVENLKHRDFWARAQAMRKSFVGENNVVVELKHQGTVPSWISGFLKQHHHEKVSFSKYCYAMTETFFALDSEESETTSE